MNMDEIIESSKEELKNRVKKGQDIDRAIEEVADEGVPIYNAGRLELLQDDYSLAMVEDPGMLPENPSVWDILAVSIYEKIYETLQSYRDEIIEETKKFNFGSDFGFWEFD